MDDDELDPDFTWHWLHDPSRDELREEVRHLISLLIISAVLVIAGVI